MILVHYFCANVRRRLNPSPGRPGSTLSRSSLATHPSRGTTGLKFFPFSGWLSLFHTFRDVAWHFIPLRGRTDLTNDSLLSGLPFSSFFCRQIPILAAAPCRVSMTLFFLINFKNFHSRFALNTEEDGGGLCLMRHTPPSRHAVQKSEE